MALRKMAMVSRVVHLAWCVQSEADYLALAARLPRKANIRVTIFVTRMTGSDGFSSSITAACNTATSPEVASEEAGESWNDLKTEAGVGAGSFIWVSLLSALSGLALGHWGWVYIKDYLEKPDTLINYILAFRSLPILLLLASTVIFSGIGSCIFKYTLSGKRQTMIKYDNTPVEGVCQQQAEDAPLVTEEEQVDSPVENKHHSRAGRPDLAALIRTAAVSVATVEQCKTSRLVVAVQGPAGLVEAAQSAVETVRQGGCSLNLCFSGTDSRW
jgi:hypothetical protein